MNHQLAEDLRRTAKVWDTKGWIQNAFTEPNVPDCLPDEATGVCLMAALTIGCEVGDHPRSLIAASNKRFLAAAAALFPRTHALGACEFNNSHTLDEIKDYIELVAQGLEAA